MKWTVKISTKAVEDMAQALDWTADNFGAVKRNEYVDLIELALQELANNPLHFRSKDRSDLHSYARTFPIARRGRKARHVFVYRTAGNATIEIARLLHDAMDVKRHWTP